MAQLTEGKLQELTRTSKPIVIAMGDGSGLSFCISKAGTASWKLRYRYAGKGRWLTLSRYPEVNLKEAKERATKGRSRINDGIDPIAEKRRAKIALRAARTFSELAEDFMVKTGAKSKPASRVELCRYIDRDLVPRLGSLRIDAASSAMSSGAGFDCTVSSATT